MEIFVKRDTGFYGFASPLKLQVGEQKAIYLENEKTRKIDVLQPDFTLQASMFLLKSHRYEFKEVAPGTTFVVKMEPRRKMIYIGFFVLLMLVALWAQSLIALLVAILIYSVFLAWMMQGIYIIEKEDEQNG